VRYATASAFRTALEERLLTAARQTNVPVVRLRKLVVFERLLARLLVVSQDRWILKGALALDFRLGAGFRTTQDMDLARADDERSATADFLAAQDVDLQDYFSFAIQKTARLDAALEGAAVRYHAHAELAGRAFEDVIVDVGFGDPVVTAPDLVPGPSLLGFAGVDPVEVPVLSIEQQIAEKVHAYTRQYVGGRHSSRVKDLIDLVLIRSHVMLEAGSLRLALRTVFVHRGSHPLPMKLPSPPLEWSLPYRKMASTVELDADLSEGYRVAAAFLDPVLDGTVPDVARWYPGDGNWRE